MLRPHDICKDTDDVTLWRLAVSGNRTAADLLISKHIQGLFAFHLTRVRNREDAWDLTQETCFRIHQCHWQFDPRKGSYKGWCVKIACNLQKDFWRRLKTRAALWSGPALETLNLAGDQDFGEGPSGLDLERALDRLDPFYRTVFGLHQEGLTDEEGADAIGLPLRTFQDYKGKLLKYLHQVLTLGAYAPRPRLPLPPRLFRRLSEEE